MSVIINGTDDAGVTLTTPVTVSAGGSVNYGGFSGAAVVDGTGPGTLVNFGQIQAELVAVSLAEGGFVYNGASGVISAVEPIEIADNATLINAGRISGDAGIVLGNAAVTNEAGGQIQVGLSATDGFVVNDGTIGSAGEAAVSFKQGGTVDNAGTKSLLGGGTGYGVVVYGAAGFVTNQGTIAGVNLIEGGQISNSGVISKINDHYGITTEGGIAGDVTNSGFVSGIAIQGAVGGVLTNAAGGTISGYVSGAYLYGGTLLNAGLILGVGGAAGLLNPQHSQGVAGATLAAAGLLDNAAGGVIEGLKYGMWLASAGGGASTVVNAGTVIGDVGLLDSGKTADTIFNAGLILGSAGVAVSLAATSDLLVLESGSTLQGKVVGGTGQSVVEFDYGAGGAGLNIGSVFIDISTLVNAGSLSLSGDATLTSDPMFVNDGVLLSGGANFETLGSLQNAGTIAGGVTLGVPDYLPLGKTFTPYLVNEAGAVLAGGTGAAVLELGGTGDAAATIVNAGTIEAGSDGVAISFAAGGNGVLILDAGSSIDGLVIGGGGSGSLLELAKGSGVGTISGLGSEIVDFANISVASGADWLIGAATFSSLVDNGDVALGASEEESGAAGAIAIGAGATLSLSGTVSAGQTISFNGGSGILQIADASAFYGTIAGFAPGVTIDLTGLAFGAGGSVSESNGVLKVVEDGQTVTAALPGVSSKDVFHLSSDGVNGTDVTATAPVAACFLKGTRIATFGGEVAVEALGIGDLVVDPEGSVSLVKWIGRRRYLAGWRESETAAKMAAREMADVTPVCIAAGALADGVPERDLYVSPMHAMYLDGYLVPAGALVNGASVRSCPEIEDIYYYHIETDMHALVLANGAPAETFIDHGSRRMFENAEEFYRLYPKGALNEEEFLAPRLESGPELERLRRQVALRAGVLLGQDQDAEVVGYLESADRQVITGWAFMPAQPHVPVRLEVVANGAVLARTVANLPRPDVRAAGFGHGRCGFQLTLPAALPALRRHEISVRPVGGAMLAGSPVVLDPGIAPELLQTGGLAALIAAAAKGGGPAEAAALGAALESAGRQLLSAAARKPARPRRDGPLVLVIDEFWPAARRDAGSNAVRSHVTALQALGYRVAFCAAEGEPADAGSQAAVQALRSRQVECYGQDGASVESVIRELADCGLELVYVHRLAAATAYAGLVRLHAPAAKVIYAIADLHHLRLRRQAAAERRPELLLKAANVQAAEFWAMRMADAVITHSAAEAAYLDAELPMANVHVVPWTVPARGTFRDDGSRVDVAFIGGAGHAPNADAVEFLGRAVMPQIWQVLPEVKCLVIGGGWSVDRLASMDARMVGTGQVGDLEEALASARLTMAPLRFGAGIKGKVLDSFAVGLPCVMTQIAAEGLALDEELLRAVSDEAGFAARVLDVYGNAGLRRRLRRAGQKLVRQGWSDEAVRDAMAAVVGRARVRAAEVV